MHVKFEVCSFNHFGAIGILHKEFRGSRDPGFGPFSKNFYGVMSGLSLGTCMSKMKSVTLTVLELFAFNSHFKLV